MRFLRERKQRGRSPGRDDPSEGSGISIDDFYAFMPTHGYIFAPTGAMWPASSVNARILPIIDNGKAVPASAWLDRHRHVEQMTWAPGESSHSIASAE
jgi:hypothetical protein